MCRGRVQDTKDVRRNVHDINIRKLAGKQVIFGIEDVEDVIGDHDNHVILVKVQCTDNKGGGVIGLSVIKGITPSDQKEIEDIRRDAVKRFFNL